MNILRSEFNESMQNRQNAKMAFLAHEISQYEDLNRRLNETLKLKKNSMQFLARTSNAFSPTNKQQSRITTAFSNSQSKSASTTLTAMTAESKDALLRQMAEENMRLLQSFDLVSNERNNAQSKALIAQQVAEEVENYQSDLMAEDEEQLLELRRIVQDKEYTVQEFEKQKAMLIPGGVALKYKDVITPADQLDKVSNVHSIHSNTIDVLKKHASILTEQIAKADIENEFNGFELVKLKQTIKNPMNLARLGESISEEVKAAGNKKSFVPSDNLISKQKTSDEIHLLSENLRKKLIGLPQGFSVSAHTAQLMKSNSQEQKAATTSEEEELLKCRRLFSREVLNERILEEQFVHAQTLNATLMQRNDLILNSNQLHNSAIEKLQVNVNFYYNYHKKLQAGSSSNSSSGAAGSVNGNANSGSSNGMSAAGSLGGISSMATSSFLDGQILAGRDHGGVILNRVKEEEVADHSGNHLILMPSEDGEDAEEVQAEHEILQNSAQKNHNYASASKKVNEKNSNHAHGNILAEVGEDNNNNINNEEEEDDDDDDDEDDDSLDLEKCKQFLRNMAEDFYASHAGSQIALSRKIITRVSTKNGGIGFQMKRDFCTGRVRSFSNVIEYGSIHEETRKEKRNKQKQRQQARNEQKKHDGNHRVRGDIESEEKQSGKEKVRDRKKSKKTQMNDEKDMSCLLGDDDFGIDINRELNGNVYSNSDMKTTQSRQGKQSNRKQQSTFGSIGFAGNTNNNNNNGSVGFNGFLRSSTMGQRKPILGGLGGSVSGGGGTHQSPSKKINPVVMHIRGSLSLGVGGEKIKGSGKVNSVLQQQQQQQQQQESFVSNDDEDVFDPQNVLVGVTSYPDETLFSKTFNEGGNHNHSNSQRPQLRSQRLNQF